MPITGTCTVCFELANTGSRAGTGIVQLYIRDLYSSYTRPVKELKNFARVHLEAGETKTVRFDITPDKLAFFDREMHSRVEKGAFEILIGASSRDEDLQKARIEVN